MTNSVEYRRQWAAKHPDKVRAYGAKYRETHADKLHAAAVKYRAGNWEAIEARRRQRRYGISPDEHAALLKKQKGGCAICGRKNGSEKRRLATDHDHRTGKIRGLLCYVCNTKIVVTVEKFPGLIARAFEYIKEK